MRRRFDLCLSVLCVFATTNDFVHAADVPISISGISNAADPYLPTLPVGATIFGGVNFDLLLNHSFWVGNVGNTAPDLAATIGTNVASPGMARILVLTGNTFKSEMNIGDRVGSLNFSYSSGPDDVVPLLVGVNVREWSVGSSTEITTFSSPNLQQVWSGIDTRGIDSAVDMLTVPLDSSRILAGITIRDESISTINKVDPVLAMRAITIQTVPEPASIFLSGMCAATFLCQFRSRRRKCRVV